MEPARQFDGGDHGIVLYQERHARKGAIAQGRRCEPPGVVIGFINDRVQLWINLFDLADRILDQFDRRDLPGAKKEIAGVAARFSTADILRRIRRLEEMRDNLGRNIQEALAIEVAFLKIFGT